MRSSLKRWQDPESNRGHKGFASQTRLRLLEKKAARYRKPSLNLPGFIVIYIVTPVIIKKLIQRNRFYIMALDVWRPPLGFEPTFSVKAKARKDADLIDCSLLRTRNNMQKAAER
jgi:hypothetical protein